MHTDEHGENQEFVILYFPNFHSVIPMPNITHTVTEKHVSKRLDIYIAHYEPHISRNRIQTLIKSGFALVDGKQEKPGYKVKLG